MMLHFYKMTGTGKDFVMLDNRDLSLSSVLVREHIADICDRCFGVGAEGVIAVEPAEAGGDVRMRYYTADGGEAEACEESGRCFTAFVDFLLEGERRQIVFETMAGIAKGMVHEDDRVTVLLPAAEVREDEVQPGAAFIIFRGEVILCEEDACCCAEC